jgi:hypothetical protein
MGGRTLERRQSDSAADIVPDVDLLERIGNSLTEIHVHTLRANDVKS